MPRNAGRGGALSYERGTLVTEGLGMQVTEDGVETMVDVVEHERVPLGKVPVMLRSEVPTMPTLTDLVPALVHLRNGFNYAPDWCKS